MGDRHWPEGAWLAEFGDPDRFRAGVRAILEAGYERIEIYSPYPLDDLIRQLRYRPTRLPLAGLAGGIAGGLLGYGIQWYTNVISYPMNIGGRPAHAVLPFLLSTFEGAVLLAALGAFFGYLVTVRLPRLWHPVFEIDGFERATVDRFFLAVDRRQDRGDELPKKLMRLGALRVVKTEATR